MNNNQSILDLFFLDIETVPQADSYVNLTVENQKLFYDKISKTMPEGIAIEEAYHNRAGILAEFAKVVCISTGFFYKDKGGRICLKIKSIAAHNERDLLQQFNGLIEKMYKHNPNFQFSGHNIREFDIPFLCRRMLINGLKLPAPMNIHGAKPWEIKWVDTLHWWRFGDYKNYTSLNLLACILGIPTSKDDIDGSMVQQVYYKENNLQRITDYCQKDVIVVARIVQKFMNLPLVTDENIFYADK